MTSHDRNSISFGSSLASTEDYSVAYSSDLVATKCIITIQNYLLKFTTAAELQ